MRTVMSNLTEHLPVPLDMTLHAYTRSGSADAAQP